MSGSEALFQARKLAVLRTLDDWRHRIPFWWWLTYDALVGVVIVVGVAPSDPAFWLGFVVLGIAVAIDAVEFAVKRPSSRALLDAPSAPVIERCPDGSWSHTASRRCVHAQRERS